MFAAKTTAAISTPFRLVVLCLLAAAIAGGVLSQRAPAHVPLPIMADRPVIMPSGDALYVQRHEVTVAEWNTCNADGTCTLKLRVRPDQDPYLTPATGLSYIDVQEYLGWMKARSGHNYRLPTAAEWQYMAADVLDHAPNPLFTDPSLTWASSYLVEGITPRALRPQGSFSTSPEGIADLDGSVWEWTMECYDGTSGASADDYCPAFFVGGEHLAAMSFLVRDAARGGCAVGTPPAHLGMRLVSDEAR
ncbi:formylglycine-generating enzyme family protein [Roseovarius aquimarinus]|uniref:Formylglycine-generating enzyme family protein n=1 Tax=Roseovarius aquimarinus TaxID=1229156 RepID=A0ABW7ICK2_9RHOB